MRDTTQSLNLHRTPFLLCWHLSLTTRTDIIFPTLLPLHRFNLSYTLLTYIAHRPVCQLYLTTSTTFLLCPRLNLNAHSCPLQMYLLSFPTQRMTFHRKTLSSFLTMRTLALIQATNAQTSSISLLQKFNMTTLAANLHHLLLMSLACPRQLAHLLSLHQLTLANSSK